MQVNQQFYAPTSSYYGQQQQMTTTTGQTSQSTQSYAATQAGGASTSGTAQTSQTSISDMLAAASERVLERCGLEYDETAGMYYDANSALYYDQVHTILYRMLWEGESLIIFSLSRYMYVVLWGQVYMYMYLMYSKLVKVVTH